MILVAIGANLAGPRGASPLETCRHTLPSLAALPGLALKACSRWFSTAPEPPADQPSYVNGVARLHGACEPEWLLEQLHAMEAREGRVRGAPNASRTLDLDIVAIDDRVRSEPDPILPHPRAHLRRFVLVPLAEVAPGWVHPVLRRPVEALIADLAGQPMHPIGL